MKTLTRTLILAVITGCVISSSASFAGSRSGKGGSSKGGSSKFSFGNRGSHGNSSSQRRSSFSGHSGNRFSSGSNFRQNNGHHSSKKHHFSNTSSKHQFNKGGQHKVQHGQSKLGHHISNLQKLNNGGHNMRHDNHGKNVLKQHDVKKQHGLNLHLNNGRRFHVNPHHNHNWKHFVTNVMHRNRNHWCHTRPAVCHWWASYCRPIAYSHHTQLTTCNFHHVACKPVLQFGIPTVDVQWYLGMKGLVLPGKGIGIEAVEPNSPAAAAGLQPGMVLTVCNGIQLVNEASMQEAIRISGGVLNMTLLSSDGTQILEGAVQMTQVM